jgi:hypothetical protein
MKYLMLDTCVLLDISTTKSTLPIVSALEIMVSSGLLVLTIPELVIAEFSRNKEEVADKTRRRLAQEFKQVRSVIDEFGGENKGEALSIIMEVGAKLPLLSEANYATIKRVEYLIESSFKAETTDTAMLAAVSRGLEKRAPFHHRRCRYY